MNSTVRTVMVLGIVALGISLGPFPGPSAQASVVEAPKACVKTIKHTKILLAAMGDGLRALANHDLGKLAIVYAAAAPERRTLDDAGARCVFRRHTPKSCVRATKAAQQLITIGGDELDTATRVVVSDRFDAAASQADNARLQLLGLAQDREVTRFDHASQSCLDS